MKKDRDCGMPYPIYPNYQGMNMVPPMGMPYGMPNMMMQNPITYTTNSSNVSTNTVEQQLNTLQQQVNSLEKRVNTLENMYNTNKYSSSNYQMM